MSGKASVLTGFGHRIHDEDEVLQILALDIGLNADGLAAWLASRPRGQ